MEKNFNGFIYDENADLETVLEQHSKYETRRVLTQKEQELQQKSVAESNAKQELEQRIKRLENEKMLSNVPDENKKIVGDLLEHKDFETIKNEYPTLFEKKERFVNYEEMLNQPPAQQIPKENVLSEEEFKHILKKGTSDDEKYKKALEKTLLEFDKQNKIKF